MKPFAGYRRTWRYAREVGYPRSFGGWKMAFADLFRATPGLRALLTFGVEIDEWCPLWMRRAFAKTPTMKNGRPMPVREPAPKVPVA